MLGVFLSLVFFTFLCILFIRFQKPQAQLQPSQTTSTSPWWVKIITEKPRCTYYFGPFDTVEEAKLSQAGYIEDLEQEGAIGIAVDILQDQPTVLTIDEEEEDE